MKSKRGSFVARLSGWEGQYEVILIVTDDETLKWLTARFGRFAAEPSPSTCPPFLIGDGNPIDSDGRCRIEVVLEEEGTESRIEELSTGSWRWSVTRAAAGLFRDRIALIREFRGPSQENVRRAKRGLLDSCHDYLDPANHPPAPTVIISRGEYTVESLRRAARGYAGPLTVER